MKRGATFTAEQAYRILDDASGLVRSTDVGDALLFAQQLTGTVLAAFPANEARKLWENIGVLAGFQDVPLVAKRRE